MKVQISAIVSALKLRYHLKGSLIRTFTHLDRILTSKNLQL